MPEEKFTPGPWRVRTTIDTSGDYDFPTYDILAIHEWGPEGISTAFQNPHNANLISSSIDLYHALLKAIEICDGEGYEIPGAREAIAKARGESKDD